MKECLCRFMGLLFLVSSVVASERSSRELDSQLRHASSEGNEAACRKLLGQGAALNGRGRNGVTPLCAASEKGRGEVVKLLLGSKAQVNEARDDGVTALYAASQNGHSEVVKLLLESKTPVNIVRDTGATPLFIVSQNGHSQIVKLLLGNKAQVDVARTDGVRPLFIASQNGHCEVVKLLLENNAQVNGVRADGVTPLFMASQRGYGGVCQLLLDGKAAINMQTKKDKKTALHIAVQHNHLTCVTVLLQAGADVTVCDVQGDTPIVYATNQKNRELCVLLNRYGVEKQELDSQLRNAARSGNAEVCEKLLAQGAALNGLGRDGATPLFMASQEGRSEIVKLLLGNKAQVDTALDNGVTPLFMASQEGHGEIVKVLLGSNAEIDAARADGATPLFMASQNGHVEIVALLLVSNAQVDAAKKDGATPLFIASQFGHGEICQLLVDSKAAISMQTKKNEKTALHASVFHNHLACATVLLKAGADVTLCDVHGDTPFVYAAKQRNRELCTLLSRYGAEIKVSRWSINKSRKKLAKYVQSVLSSDDSEISSADSDCQSIDQLLSIGQDMSQYPSAPIAKQLHYAKILSTLHTVAQEGDCEKLEMIFGFGVPVDQLNADGYTALHLAVIEGHYAVCYELLKHGANMSIQTPQGETALKIAQRVGHKEIAELLKNAPEQQEQGAVSLTDADYQTFNRLVHAIKGASETSTISLRAQDYSNIFSALHTVARTGDREQLKMILEFGVPVDFLNDDGYTALHLAVIEGQDALCADLLTYGADKSIKTPEGETALQIAQRIGNKKLVELLD